MTRLPVHVDIDGFDVADNCLVIAGRKITELVDEFGGTPIYLYDAHLIEQRIADLRRDLPNGIHIHYAMKANPLPELVKFVAERVDGLDVASAGELDIALQTGTRSRDVSFAGPGKRDAELAHAVDSGVTVNIESANELHRLHTIAKQRRVIADIAIRVNPDFELKSSGMKMSGGPKPFGIDAEAVPSVLHSLARLPHVAFRGFHIFSGSQNLDAASIADAQAKALELAVKLNEHAPRPTELVNIGGGFGIPYFPGDRRLDVRAIGASLGAQLSRLAQALPNVEVVIELGRYLVGEAGAYVSRVVDKKGSRGTTYLITDGGLNHHLAASGNFGQVIRKNYPVVIGNRVHSHANEIATVVGPLCTPLDILADKMPLGHAEVGDLVVVLQSGAYGRSASPDHFLSHPPPGETLLHTAANPATRRTT